MILLLPPPGPHPALSEPGVASIAAFTAASKNITFLSARLDRALNSPAALYSPRDVM